MSTQSLEYVAAIEPAFISMIPCEIRLDRAIIEKLRMDLPKPGLETEYFSVIADDDEPQQAIARRISSELYEISLWGTTPESSEVDNDALTLEWSLRALVDMDGYIVEARKEHLYGEIPCGIAQAAEELNRYFSHQTLTIW